MQRVCRVVTLALTQYNTIHSNTIQYKSVGLTLKLSLLCYYRFVYRTFGFIFEKCSRTEAKSRFDTARTDASPLATDWEWEVEAAVHTQV